MHSMLGIYLTHKENEALSNYNHAGQTRSDKWTGINKYFRLRK